MDLNKALQNPANFLYLFADEKNFLSKLDSRTASIIRAKKRNQQQVLVVAAGGNQNYNDARNQVRQALVDTYGKSPELILVDLANGKQVAGKNWAAGIYGVGKVIKTTFSQNSGITVDPETGFLMQGDTIVGKSSGDYVKQGNRCVANTYSYTDESGNTFTSQYNKATKKYYAATYTTADGLKQNAEGQEVTNADSSSIWANVIESVSMFIQWLISLFTGSSDRTLITDSNTVPSQSDGFIQETNNASGWLIAALVGGALFFGMPKTGKKKSSKKKSK